MKRSLLSFLAIMCLLPILPGQEATIREEKQVIKTYPFSGPDPSPIMTRSSMWGRGLRLYPYFSFDNLSYNAVDQSWNVIRMENPYIEAFIMPEEGGKLIGAVEKASGKEFIYRNSVRKFRHIALRGPWTAGGVELNFGIVGHTPATATPVDYVTRKNPDGSVTTIVGNMDLPSRTHWRVAFTVPPDKAYIEARSLWYNPMPLNQSYYVWMNAANRLTKDLEFIFPGNMHIGHNYMVPSRTWPMTADGRNLAFYREHDDSDEGSFFIHGALQEFSGSYWKDSDFGYGHWAIHEEVPGQKFFRWPLSREGGIWENLLTDTDGPYFEPQTGRLLDQNDHEFFPPYTTDQWRELYFPFKKIGPMVKATPYGALNARQAGNGVIVRFCALQKIDEQLVVRSGGKEIYTARVALGPMEVFEHTIPAQVPKGQLRVDVGDKLAYSDDPKTDLLKRPLTFREYEETTLEGLYQAAEREEKGRNYDVALEKYLACLKREPLHVRALVRVAELYCRRAEYKKALEYAHKALDYVMYDADANFIYGIISRRMDNLVDAKETLGWAARSMKYRASAYSELGSIYLMEGNSERAIEYLRRSLKYDADNVFANQLLATTYRVTKQFDKAREALNKVLELDPLNHQARFEQYLIEPGSGTLDNFKSMIRNELPHETYLEIAAYYRNLRLDGDAVKVLEAAPDQGEIRYWQAYLLRETSPAQSQAVLKNAAALSPYLVFPFREEAIPVFEWAAKTLPGNWKAKYYLGLVYWGLRRTEDARTAFAQFENVPDYGPAYISRAYLLRDSNPAKALADYERAYAVDKKDWRNWYHLGTYYGTRGMHDKALKIALEASSQFPDQDLIKILLARTYLNNQRYQDCYEVLSKATILPFEGQRDVHQIYVQCQLALALENMKKQQFEKALELLDASREYPERLGTGKPHAPDYRIQDHLAAFCYDNMGQAAKAAEARKQTRAAAAVNTKVGQWYKTALASENELAALRELSNIVRGGSRRRR